MSIRFATQTRTIPTGTGIAKTAGTVDGFYYAVDRTAANPTAYLTDNTGSWFNNTTAVTFTNNVATISTAITDLRINSGGTSATTFVAIAQNFIINAGGRIIKATGNQSIYFINCNFTINDAEGWANYTLGHNSVANDGNSQLNFGPGQTTNGGMMFYGCTFTSNTNETWGFAPSEMIGCTFTGGSGAADLPLIGAGNSGRYINTDFSANSIAGFRGWQMYGIPAVINGCSFFNIAFGNIGNGQAGPLLLNAPAFTFPGQVQYYQGNSPGLADQVVQTYAGIQYATTGAGWMNANGTGFFGWGGTDAARGYAGFVNYQGLGFTFQDFSAAAVRNVRLRVRSNHQLNTGGATLVARLPTTTTAQQNLIQGFLSDSQGRLNYENVATDGATFTAGYLNYLTGQTSSTAPATAGRWNINANSVATPDYTPIVLASVGRPTGSGASPTINYINTQVAWDIRSFTNAINLTGSRDYSTQLNVQLSDLGSRQTAALNANVKTAAVAAMNAVTNGNIDNYFLGRFPSTIGTTDVNDVFDAARYEWFNFALATEPTADANGNVNVGNANFTLNQAATGGTIATKGYTYDTATNTWIVRASYFLTNSANRVNGGVITTGTITLTSQANAIGSYAPLTAATIALNGTAIFQPLTATTQITGMSTINAVVINAAVNFGSSTITPTGNLSFTNATLSGTCALNVGTTNRNLVLTNCGDLSAAFPFTRVGTATIFVNPTGNTVLPNPLPTGFVANVTTTITVNLTTPVTAVGDIKVAEFYLGNTLSPASTGPVLSNGNATITWTIVKGVNDVLTGIVFADFNRPVRIPNTTGLTVTVTAQAETLVDFPPLGTTPTAFAIVSANSIATYASNKLNVLTPNATSYNPGNAAWAKYTMRRIFENGQVTTVAWRKDVALGNSPLPQAIFVFTPQGSAYSTGTSPIFTPTYTVQMTKDLVNNGTSVFWQMWNTLADAGTNIDWNGTITDANQKIVYPILSPGDTVALTPGDVLLLASGVSSDLVGTDANPGPLSLLARGIEDGSLLIPTTIALPD